VRIVTLVWDDNLSLSLPLLKLRKLRLDPRHHRLRHHYDCLWGAIRRRSRRTRHGGADFQFRGDNRWFHVNVGDIQLGLHCVLPPSCVKVGRITNGTPRRLTLGTNSWRVFTYSYLGINISTVCDTRYDNPLRNTPNHL
jgi:hypothetical protein